MIARGLDPREAAEAVYMPRHQREGWETYGQVESHVRQVWNGTVGWFGHDFYDINPLPVAEEARRSVAQMGGPQTVRDAAAAAAAEDSIAGWQWALRLTPLLLQLDPGDGAVAKTRAAARALGQRTTSANASGWCVSEALEREGALRVQDRTVTLAMVRSVLGTPRPEELVAAGTAANLDLLRSLIDPRRAEDARATFTLEVPGDDHPWRIDLRNGVIVAAPAKAPLADHLTLPRDRLAAFVLGLAPPASGTPLATLDAVLDRSVFVFLTDCPVKPLDSPADALHLMGEGAQRPQGRSARGCGSSRAAARRHRPAGARGTRACGRSPRCACALQRANRLREFIAAVEDRARHDGELTPEKRQWIEWASAKADWLDPLVRHSDPILDAPEPEAPSFWRY